MDAPKRRATARIVLSLPQESLDALREQAVRQYRTPKAEATRLLLDGLARARRTHQGRGQDG